MSQTVDLREPPQEEFSSPQDNTFEYHPVPPTAVVGFVLGLLSFMALLGVTGIVIAAVGTILSLLSLIKILRSRGLYSGRNLAIAGFVLSAAFMVSGCIYQRHLYQNEVPAGFERISFSRDISRDAFITEHGEPRLNPEVAALEDKPVFLKGFVYPTERMTGLSSFLLLKDSDECCFGGDPAVEDMIGVVMEDGQTIDYYAGRVSVAGTFELNKHYSGNKLEPLFLMKGQVVTHSKTAFD
ncbi:MAG: hypothetical protein DWQ34_16115 [Planctomycetota bacterium]|nr:MAG: hypothetical protein DWQ34_16115 [Planctomycetota bacterium]REK30992.1 MAG: hypothetical protein DWQ41_00785 [Planctomycetota bacterium]REK36892.1 MAG: hypothetical protein DWQ45_09825 [Planctomycetota bacterium]